MDVGVYILTMIVVTVAIAVIIVVVIRRVVAVAFTPIGFASAEISLVDLFLVARLLTEVCYQAVYLFQF